MTEEEALAIAQAFVRREGTQVGDVASVVDLEKGLAMHERAAAEPAPQGVYERVRGKFIVHFEALDPPDVIVCPSGFAVEVDAATRAARWVTGRL